MNLHRSDRRLRTRVGHCRCYAEDLLRVKDLQVLKTLTISPIDMLVRRDHSSTHDITLMKRRRPWGTYPNTSLGMTLHFRGRRRPAFPGTHLILVR